MKFIPEIKYVKCPSCEELKFHPVVTRNALSRKDNKTYVCADCGTMEALLPLREIIEETTNEKEKERLMGLHERVTEDLKKFLETN